MKHIKLFESFIAENYSKRSPKFNMPDFYVMPNGLSRNKVYVVKLTYFCENLIYALMDYSQLEKTYELLNLNLVSEKIQWYSWMIYEFPNNPNVEEESKKGDPLYNQKVLAQKNWSIQIIAEAESDKFPYYVFIPKGDEPPSIMKKLKEISKNCKFCGDEPDISSFRPGQITCAIGSEDVVFDPGMGMELSDIIYDDSGTYEIPQDIDRGFEPRGFYIRFDSLGAFLASYHPSYHEFNRFIKSKFVVDNSKIFEILQYKPELVGVRNLIQGKEGSRDFLDDIFAFLIDEDAPQKIVKEISDLLNPDDYELQTMDFYRAKLNIYMKRILSWDPLKKSLTPDFKQGNIFLALPDDRSLVVSILNKLPKDYQEIKEGLDSIDPSFLQKNMDDYGSDFSTLDSYKEMLKSNIYFFEKNSITKQKINLYDGKLPSIDVLMNETHCDFFYGIFRNITADEINRMSPIELYLNVFFQGKSILDF